jgi:hypothetical protein
MIKNVVYTCITGNYDEIPTVKPFGNFDFICFLDSETFEANRFVIEKSNDVQYRLVPISGVPQDVNRTLKMQPQDFLGEYDLSLYIDGNIRLRSNPFMIEGEIPSNMPIALYLQPHRDCVFREVDELVRVGIAKGTAALNLKIAMKTFGMKEHYGLHEANIIFRRHNDSNCVSMMHMWSQLWSRAQVKRDQPLLAFINFLTKKKFIYDLGYSGLLDNTNPYFFYQGRIVKKGRAKRFARRIISELFLYRFK